MPHTLHLHTWSADEDQDRNLLHGIRGSFPTQPPPRRWLIVSGKVKGFRVDVTQMNYWKFWCIPGVTPSPGREEKSLSNTNVPSVEVVCPRWCWPPHRSTLCTDVSLGIRRGPVTHHWTEHKTLMSPPVRVINIWSPAGRLWRHQVDCST